MNKYYLPLKERAYQDIISSLFQKELENYNQKITNITIQVTEDCCMACTYCYQHNKSPNKMTFETAKNFIDKLLNDEITPYTKLSTFTIVIDFIGGEPLMEIDLIEQICEYTIKSMIEKKHPWLYYLKFSIGSNGLLYNTPKVQNFFKKYKCFCSYSISVDGNKQLHDACRIDLQGHGTYDRVIEAVNLFKENNNGLIPSTKMTISPDNVAYTFDALTNLINLGYESIMVNCVYENVWNNAYANILYLQLKLLADYLIENNLYNKIYIRMFDEEQYCPLNPDLDDENWCGGVGDKCIALNYSGNMYPCIRYMESSLNNRQEPIIIGNIYTGYLATKKQKENMQLISNITRRSQSTDECFYCPIAKGCSWCSAYCYEEFGTPNKRTTYTCCMHKAQSLANVYYWNKLYQHLKINDTFKMYVPREWALEIIDEKEYNYLLKLSNQGEMKCD